MNNHLKTNAHREINRRVWDRMAIERDRLATPATDSDFQNPLKSIDANGWLGNSIAGKNILCLAAGGGRHGPLYAAAGARVTVVDLSPNMLELDRQVAQHRQLQLTTFEASMEDLSFLADAIFDFVIHPVSTCYVPDIGPVFSEIARVLRCDGIYISQHKQPTSLQTSLTTQGGKYLIQTPYYSNRPLSAVKMPNLVREFGTTEFLHRWQQLLGGICGAGMLIEDISEPHHADISAPVDSFEHRSFFVPPYIRIKARRTVRDPHRSETKGPGVWIP